MKEIIGETAGNIWSALKNNEEINVSQLPKMISQKPVIAYQALGWLAREGKIVYHTKGSNVYISLDEI